MVRQGATTKPGVRHGLSRTSGAEVSKLGPDVGLIQARERRRDSGAEGAENRHRNEAETGCRHRGMGTKPRLGADIEAWKRRRESGTEVSGIRSRRTPDSGTGTKARLGADM